MKPIRLQPKQSDCEALFKQTGRQVPTWIAFGGARGGAKSATVRYLAILLACAYDGIRVAIVRRVYGDIKVNHIDPMLAEFPELLPAYRVGDAEIRIGRSRIEFVYAESKQEVDRKFWGPEYAFILVDQAEQFSGEELRVIKTANRWPGMPFGFAKMGLFFNPGGIGTEFLRRIFHLRQYQGDEIPSEYTFIQAYGWDNYEWFRGQVDIPDHEFYKLPNDQRFALFITQTQYGRELNALPPSLRAGHLLGSFDSFAGQYFAGVWDESKVILPANKVAELIQPWWTRWMATDWGFAHYASTQWAASGRVAPKDLLRVIGVECPHSVELIIVYRELVVKDTGEADLGKLIVRNTPESERRTLQRWYVGPDAWAKRGSANSAADQMIEAMEGSGMPQAEPANNQRITDGDRIGGWRLLWNCFQATCGIYGPIAEQPPTCLFISAECPQIISSIPLLIHDDKHPGRLEDVLKVPGSLADDVGDNLRYLVQSHLDPSNVPRAVQKQEVWDSIPGTTADAMTARAMAMRRFEFDHPVKTRAVIPPRWRPHDN